MGFGEKWINWIEACLKSASISILVNGSPTNEFGIKRGVRQGDPLSPFLFIITAEGLNILAKSAIEKGIFRGIEVCEDKVLVSHLQYADDTIFFREWNRINAINLRNILRCFERASGLKVNFQKSYLYGIGVDSLDATCLARYIGCQVGTLPFIYLGLPIGSKMNKLKDWNPIIDKFNSRLSSSAIEELEIGFKHSFIKSIDDGSSTLFWQEHWIGNDKLCNIFPRIYRLDRVENVCIKDRVKIVGQQHVFTWDWLRLPRGRTESELTELMNLLSTFSLSVNGNDTWKWNLAPNGMFTVKKLSVLIDSKILGSYSAPCHTMRNCLIPKKKLKFLYGKLKKNDW
ncbi:uncharacterized protein [Rutidosis leptorrhynchoides]|uniref:uncharacterized protein n=1 Tax=Rutidosis leptorrhynchoides TaxID=125765 RepID=UPI003A992673